MKRESVVHLALFMRWLDAYVVPQLPFISSHTVIPSLVASIQYPAADRSNTNTASVALSSSPSNCNRKFHSCKI